MAATNTCMGIYEFSNKNIELFHNIIKPLIETLTGITYVDAMSYYEPKTIKMDLISKMIEEAKIVIIDISGNNPNVFYEFGVACNKQKNMVILCSDKNFHDKKIWGGKLPFDIQGRELLIFKTKKDLKVKLGRFIFDALYKTNHVTLSWLNLGPKIPFDPNYKPSCHVKSTTEIEIIEPSSIGSNIGINNNFIISYHVAIHEILKDKNPDIRIVFLEKVDSYPRIVCIFPWELSSINPDEYECHIDYFPDGNIENHERIQQVSAGKKIKAGIIEFDVFISFCWPNLVFESTFFKDEIERLYCPITYFVDHGYPHNQLQYICFEVFNCHAIISNIEIKEVLL